MDREQLLNDPEEAFRIAFEGKQSCMWTAGPGIITAVDFVKNTCTVQLAVQGTVQDETGAVQSVNMPILDDVPIIWPRAGGFALTFPLAVNDEVLVVFGARCIDAWWQSGGIQRPMEARMHDLSDAFAIPGPASQPKKLANVSATSVQLRNEAGSTYIEINAAGKINIVAPSGVELTGNLLVNGGISANGNIVSNAGTMTALDFIAGLIPFTTHKHTGVTTGGGTSGGPVP